MMKMCLFHISSKNRKIIVLVFLALLLLLLLILLRCKSYVCAEGRGALSLIFRILSLSLSLVYRRLAFLITREKKIRRLILSSSLCETNSRARAKRNTGPSDTPYQGGTFLVDIHITNSYPFEPPKMKFLTKVWHPNVSSQSGAICLDVLKDQWTPALTIKTALLSVQALLAAAEPDDPQDAVVAKMYVSNRAQFDAQAKEWTEKYAKEGQKIEPVKDPKVLKLMEMGFGEQDAERALAKCNFNQEEALEYLLAQ